MLETNTGSILKFYRATVQTEFEYLSQSNTPMTALPSYFIINPLVEALNLQLDTKVNVIGEIVNIDVKEPVGGSKQRWEVYLIDKQEGTNTICSINWVIWHRPPHLLAVGNIVILIGATIKRFNNGVQLHASTDCFVTVIPKTVALAVEEYGRYLALI